MHCSMDNLCCTELIDIKITDNEGFKNFIRYSKQINDVECCDDVNYFYISLTMLAYNISSPFNL